MEVAAGEPRRGTIITMISSAAVGEDAFNPRKKAGFEAVMLLYGEVKSMLHVQRILMLPKTPLAQNASHIP